MTLKDINYAVTIKSEINDRNSLVHVRYLQNQFQFGRYTLIGQLQVLAGPPYTLKCFSGPIVTLSDPHSQEKTLCFKIIDGSSLTIHKKKDNKIHISGSHAALLIFKKNEYEEIIESIIAQADENEKNLGCFTYNNRS